MDEYLFGRLPFRLAGWLLRWLESNGWTKERVKFSNLCQFHHSLSLSISPLSQGVCIIALALHYQIGTGLIFVALLCEVNAIFLHLRQVLLMHGVARVAAAFRAVKTLNLVTFVAFRLLPMLYAGYYACTAPLPAVLAVITPVVTVFVISLNFVLFRRVIYNDFMRRDNNNKRDETCIMDR